MKRKIGLVLLAWLFAAPAGRAAAPTTQSDGDIPHFAQLLAEQGKNFYAHEQYSEALFRFQLDLALQLKLHGSQDHPDVAAAYLGEANCLTGLGRFGEALPAYRDAMGMLARLHPNQDRPDVAECLMKEGFCLNSQGHYEEAIPLFGRAVAMDKRLYPNKNNEDEATALSGAAMCFCSLGRYDDALPLYQHAQDIFQRLYPGRDNTLVAGALTKTASCLNSLGKFEDALPLFIQALEMERRLTRNRDNPDTAGTLVGVGVCLNLLGRDEDALPLFRQALEMFQRLYPNRDNAYVATSMTYLAGCLSSLGRYGEALPLFRQALEMDYRLYPKQDRWDVARSINDLGACLFLMGRPGEALPLYSQTLEMLGRMYRNQDHPAVAMSLHNVGNCLVSLNRAGDALPLFERSLAMYGRIYNGQDHPDVGKDLNDLACCLVKLKRFKEALPYCNSAVAMFERLYSKNGDPNIAQCLDDIGGCMFLMGRPKDALPLFRRALDIQQRIYGQADHPNEVATMACLAITDLQLNDATSAETYARQAAKMSIRYVNLRSASESESEQMDTLARYRRMLDLWLSVSGNAHRSDEEIYTQVLQWKGSVTFRQRQMRELRWVVAGSADPQIQELFEKLNLTAGQLSEVILSVPDSPTKAKEREKLIADLTARKNQLEAELSSRNAEFQRINSRPQPGLEEIQQALKNADTGATALVDFLAYDHFSESANDGKMGTKKRLLAFVIRSDRAEVVMVDLGLTEPIDKAVSDWRTAVIARHSAMEPGKILRQLAWNKLEPLLAGARTILVCPDGSLCKVAFGALPGDAEGKYLLEENAIATVPSPALLPELLRQSSAGDAGVNGTDGGLLVVGGVDYDAEPQGIPQYAVADAFFRGPEGTSWPPLDATRSEILAVADSFERIAGSSAAVKELRDEDATKEAVSELAGKYAYLHLATHGYFGSRPIAAAAGMDAKSLLGSTAEQANTAPLGALVLAGANNAQTFDPAHPWDNGYLTDMEVSQLDLHKVRLAVLSACDTGLGSDSAGEGLVGLQRAFEVAGAHTVVASLWEVPNEPTQLLMTRFYAAMWDRKHPTGPLTALRLAQEEMLQHGFERGFTLAGSAADTAVRTPPIYWGAFVLSGDWR